MLKIILADNQAIFRTGVAKVLAVEDDLRIVAQAETSDKMNMALEKFHASVMLFGAEFIPVFRRWSKLPENIRPVWC